MNEAGSGSARSGRDAAGHERQEAAGRNRRPLDWINFLLADVKNGIGPFLAIYLLAGRHWSPGRIGIVMTVAGFATVIAQAPAGALVDRITWKRRLIAIAAGLVGGFTILIALSANFWVITVAEGVIGASDSVFPPAITAVALGIVGPRVFTSRVGRNEAFNHGGNVFTAVVAGLAGYFFAKVAVLWVAAVLAVASIVAVMRVHGEDIDHRLARSDPDNEPGDGEAGKEGSLRGLLRNRGLLIFTACITLWQFANAPMLPLVGKELSTGDPNFSTVFIASSIIVAQAVMVPVALIWGRKADQWGRKPLFLVGFAVLPLRGLLFYLVSQPYWAISIQVLDGIGAGTFAVLFFIVVEDFTRGTGRYNLAIGLTSAVWGLGAALSNTVAGYIVNFAGFGIAFLFLAGCALAAFLLFLFAMPETLNRTHEQLAGYAAEAR